MRPVFVLSLSAFAAAFAAPAPFAFAVGTRTFELDSLDKLSGGDMKGVSVGSDGVVRAGLNLGEVPLSDTSASWAAVELGDKSVLVGTTGGKVFRVAGGVSSVYAETETQAVTSLVVGPGGAVYAGTIPDGKVFKLSQGKADLFATLEGAHHVWALATDRKRTALYAATGPEGRLFRISPDGTASVYFHAEEANLVSVAVGDGGEVYAGSSTRGLLYRVTGAGRATVLYDFPGDTSTEVRALVTYGSNLYAIVNEQPEAPEPPKRTSAAGRVAAGPATGARPKAGKGALYRFDPEGRPEKLMHHDEFHYMALAVDEAGVPYVGTGAEGRVYSVDEAHHVTLMADTDERQIGALVLAGGGSHGPLRGLLAGSDPAVAHPILGRGGADAVWTSKALDAGLRAKFGHLTWQAKGAVEVSSRSGDTSVPDNTWSAWSSAIPAGSLVPSPTGRFVQVRARWSGDPKAELSDVVIPFITENLRAIVTDIAASTKGAREANAKEGLVSSGAEPPRHDSAIKLTFRVDNPDADELRYRVSFKREGDATWRDLIHPDEVLTKNETEWDTSTLPEGKYRVRVTASDELANPPETTLEHTLESALILVDNTPPVFRGLTLKGRTLEGHVIDGVGPIARVEVLVDGRGEWHPVAPRDGIYDSADEELDADVHALVGPGSHLVAVRAFDAAGNAVVADVAAVP